MRVSEISLKRNGVTKELSSSFFNVQHRRVSFSSVPISHTPVCFWQICCYAAIIYMRLYPVQVIISTTYSFVDFAAYVNCKSFIKIDTSVCVLCFIKIHMYHFQHKPHKLYWIGNGATSQNIIRRVSVYRSLLPALLTQPENSVARNFAGDVAPYELINYRGPRT